MKYTALLALLFLPAFGCGDNDMSSSVFSTESGFAAPNGQDAAMIGGPQPDLTGCAKEDSDSSDYYNCFAAGDCDSPALSDSKACVEGRDYDTSVSDTNSEVVVLSIHGGLIEPYSSELASEVSSRFGWTQYDFASHGSSSCLRGWTDFTRLHITATDFDDPLAVDVVSQHKKAVSIHGYSDNRGNGRGVICVGGSNAAQRSEFVSRMNKNSSLFAEYSLIPVDAPLSGSGACRGRSPKADCSGLTGTGAHNIVNRVSSGEGGLQLEMSEGIKADLLSSESRYDALRKVFYDALSAAMKK